MPWSRRRQAKGIGDHVEVITPMTVFYNDVDSVTARRAAPNSVTSPTPQCDSN